MHQQVKSSSLFLTMKSIVLILPLFIWVSKLGAVVAGSTFFFFFCPAMAAVSDLVCAQWMVANNHNKEKGGMLLICVI